MRMTILIGRILKAYINKYERIKQKIDLSFHLNNI
jgi:hypothetical protein